MHKSNLTWSRILLKCFNALVNRGQISWLFIVLFFSFKFIASTFSRLWASTGFATSLLTKFFNFFFLAWPWRFFLLCQLFDNVFLSLKVFISVVSTLAITCYLLNAMEHLIVTFIRYLLKVLVSNEQITAQASAIFLHFLLLPRRSEIYLFIVSIFLLFICINFPLVF